MIGGQYLDITGADVALEDLHALKTGRLFAAAVGLGPLGGGVSEPREQAPWRAFGEELGVLFQAVDDVIDGDGYATVLGEDGAREVAVGGCAARARAARGARTRTRPCSRSSSTCSPSAPPDARIGTVPHR